MKLLNILTISVLTFFCVSTLAAEIYIWTDEKGVKHYSDHPPENAESYDVQTETQTYQHDEEADKQRTETEQKQLQDAIKEENENDEKQQQEAAEAERNRPPTQEEKIAAEKDKLENKIAWLEEQPLEYFGSQRNKIARIGFYRYRLEALLQDPEKYFKNPEKFEGNIKESE
ncbi:MAG: DUF4124 domain-containing protein [Desulfobacterales bacterium]|jgi:hypothetical protein